MFFGLTILVMVLIIADPRLARLDFIGWVLLGNLMGVVFYYIGIRWTVERELILKQCKTD